MTPHSWSGLTIATPEAVGSYARCRHCALVIPLAHLPLYYGRSCAVAEEFACAQVSARLAAARAAGLIPAELTDADTVEQFLASLDFRGPRHA